MVIFAATALPDDVRIVFTLVLSYLETVLVVQKFNVSYNHLKKSKNFQFKNNFSKCSTSKASWKIVWAFLFNAVAVSFCNNFQILDLYAKKKVPFFSFMDQCWSSKLAEIKTFT